MKILDPIEVQTFPPPILTNINELPLKELLWDNFERLCLRLVQDSEGFKIEDCEIYGRKGQKQQGIDIYARKSVDSYYTFQCKKYQTISPSELENIFHEFEREEWFKKTKKFFLCITVDFSDVKLQKKFEEIKDSFLFKGIEVVKWDYSVINRLLKKHPIIVYDFFGETWCKNFIGLDIYNTLILPYDIDALIEDINNASCFLSDVKNYFGNYPSSNIKRKECSIITKWIEEKLSPNKSNIFILEGEKGIGKSVILKDLYEYLKSNGYLVLGIKADKYYAKTPKELENKIFLNDFINFSRISNTIKVRNKNLIVIIDQLDALSLTLSSNREYLQTYNRIIAELSSNKNIRIIISSRSFDLDYDAELSKYRSPKINSVKASLLDEKEILYVLKLFNISRIPANLVDLLKTPNNLEVFCKLPNKSEINYDSLSSLKSLYDALWKELILKKKDLKLKKVLFRIANEMYLNQQITVADKLTEDYPDELIYLVSNQLIIQNQGVQFFHQTFYDYCFSRYFVESKQKLDSYIRENLDSIYIRSVIKMVLEYLREYDFKNYISQLRIILKNKSLRFHVKSLTINTFALSKNINTHEISVYESIIYKNKLYQETFILSIYSEGWMNYILDKDLLFNFISPATKLPDFLQNLLKRFNLTTLNRFSIEQIEDTNRNLAWSFCVNNINTNPIKILDYLDKKDFKNKDEFIERLLINIESWHDVSLLKYFEKYIKPKGNSKRDNFWFYEILKKIFLFSKEYVYNSVKDIIKSQFSIRHHEFPYDLNSFLEKIYKDDSQATFNFLFEIYNDVIEENKFIDPYVKIKSPYYKCSLFYDEISSFEYANKKIEEYLEKYINELNKQEEKFLEFYNLYKHTNSLLIVKLLINGLLNEYKKYIDEIFEIIKIIYQKKGFDTHDDNFSLILRKLVGQTYEFFSTERKDDLTVILLTIKSPYDYHFYTDSNDKRRVSFLSFGKKQYLFFLQLPQIEINNNSKLKKRFQELSRKFGKMNSDKAHDVSSFRSFGVGAPLPVKAYSVMSPADWKKSFLKYNTNYIENPGSSKGGILEHSREFEKAVMEKADIFYSLIEELFNTPYIDIAYISSGIEGLIKANYEPLKVKFLFKKLLQIIEDRVQVLYSIWKTDYFIKNNLIDIEIISFLKNNALENSDPKEPLNNHDPLFDSFNTVRGAAINKLINCYAKKEYEEIIFETVEQAVNDPQVSVKVSIIHQLALLNHLNLDRSFKIFMNLVLSNDENSFYILKNSLWSSQYFNRKYHTEMFPYFMKIIDCKDLHKDGNLIVLNYLDPKINDTDLYHKFISSSKEAKICAIRVAENNLFSDDITVIERVINILNSFLTENDDEFADTYSAFILRKIKVNNFIEFYHFLLNYSKSIVCAKEPAYFLDLLLTCVNKYPKECLNLLSSIDFSNPFSIQSRGYYDQKPVQLILAIYTKLNLEINKDSKQINKALNIFDLMLKYPHLRTSANKALELLK